MTTTRTSSLTPPIDLLRRFLEDRQAAGHGVELAREAWVSGGSTEQGA